MLSYLSFDHITLLSSILLMTTTKRLTPRVLANIVCSRV